VAVSITNIGTGSVTTAPSFSVRAPPGGIPAGSIILGILQDGATAAGVLSDTAGNVYAQITAASAGTLFPWFAGNSKALKRTDNLTYLQHTVNTGALGTFVYLTGTPPSNFLDTSVTVKASGGFTSQPSLLTSGAPTLAGEAFIAAAAAVFTGASVGTYNQDSGRGWVTPPNTLTLIPVGGTQTFSLGAGSQVNAGSGALSYQPTFSLIPTTWATFIIALSSAAISNATFGGTGSFSANTLPPTQFGTVTLVGSGSLAATATLVLSVSAIFAGAGSLSAVGGVPHNNSATFNGVGSLTANAIKAGGVATAAFSGVGSLSATASIAVAGFAQFNGTGSFSAQPSGLAGIVLFNGSGSLRVATIVFGLDAATFAGTGSLSANALLIHQGAATFAGAGNLSANTNQIANNTVVFSGTGSLTVTALLAEAANAQFNGAGSLSSAATLGVAAFAEFDGAGSLSVPSTIHDIGGFAIFAGSGGLTANLTKGVLGAFATFAGGSSLQIVFRATIFEGATFVGSGSLSLSGGVASASVAIFAGAGSLQVPQTNGGFAGYATFAGNGLLATVFNAIFTIPPFTGAGTLTVNTIQSSLENTVRASIGAVGEFALGQQQNALQLLYAWVAVFAGQGGMNATISIAFQQGQAEFDGQGRLCVWAEVWDGVTGQTTLEMCPGPGPTENVLV